MDVRPGWQISMQTRPGEFFLSRILQRTMEPTQGFSRKFTHSERGYQERIKTNSDFPFRTPSLEMMPKSSFLRADKTSSTADSKLVDTSCFKVSCFMLSISPKYRSSKFHAQIKLLVETAVSIAVAGEPARTSEAILEWSRSTSRVLIEVY